MFGKKRSPKDTQVPQDHGLSEKAGVKKSTSSRKTWSLISAFCLLISVIFLILVEVAQTHDHLRNVYFLKLDLSNIVPNTIPNAGLINSVAQSLGLHDFYKVGLWNYCAGYKNMGGAQCSTPKTLFWFNPVATIQSELLAGASINFPTQVINILHILKTASQWMFGLFLAGACLDFVMIFLTPLSLFSKWVSLPITILTFFAALFTTVATVLATVIFIIFRNAARSQTSIHIGANVGNEMFAFMWIATAFSLFALIIQLSLCCCCKSRRKAKKEWRQSNAGDFMRDGASEKSSA